MWKCPRCETLNDKEQCIICGEPRVMQNHNKTNKQGYMNFPAEIAEKQNRANMTPWLILAGIVIVFLVAVVIMLLVKLNNQNTTPAKDAPVYGTQTVQTENSIEYYPTEETWDEMGAVAPYDDEMAEGVWGEEVTESPSRYNGIFRLGATDVEAWPEYLFYSSDDFEFDIPVPSHFISQNSDNSLFFAPDMTASMEVYCDYNYLGITVEDALDEYIDGIGGTVGYAASGETWFAASVTRNGIMYYRKCFVDGNYIRYFSFDFPEEYKDVYDDYVEYIEDNFKRRDY